MAPYARAPLVSAQPSSSAAAVWPQGSQRPWISWTEKGGLLNPPHPPPRLLTLAQTPRAADRVRFQVASRIWDPRYVRARPED